LSSNLRAVSLIEWLMGMGAVILIAAALLKTEMFEGWSYAQVLLPILIPACVVHWVVLCRYLRLVKRT